MPELAMLRRLFIAVWLVLVASNPATALDQVSMQLKWKHQFQFAGYYAALEQGFYRDAGFDVIIREGGPGVDVAETVASKPPTICGRAPAKAPTPRHMLASELSKTSL
jgi:ABC-type nitrate/sulfonate/bicarbonate transport system substrate-binding protein